MKIVFFGKKGEKHESLKKIASDKWQKICFTFLNMYLEVENSFA